jgi:hypothetical protein
LTARDDARPDLHSDAADGLPRRVAQRAQRDEAPELHLLIREEHRGLAARDAINHSGSERDGDHLLHRPHQIDGMTGALVEERRWVARTDAALAEPTRRALACN